MKIHVNRVPPEGLRQHVTYDPSTMDMDRSDLSLREPLEADVVVTMTDGELVVAVAIRCPITALCSRCLEEFRRTLTADAVLTYTVHPTEVIDLTDDVRQETMLAYPMIPLCRSDCQGLCPRCGQNRNHGSCRHPPPSIAESL